MRETYRRRDVRIAFLDQFSGLTKIPMGLFVRVDGRIEYIRTSPEVQGENGYCKVIRSLGAGRASCLEDQTCRVRSLLDAQDGGLRICHAGLHNAMFHAKGPGSDGIALAFGEMIVEGSATEAEARAIHESFSQRIAGSDDKFHLALKSAYMNVPRITCEQFDMYSNSVEKAAPALSSLFHEDRIAREGLASVSHELQTRLQGILARAENLQSDLKFISWDMIDFELEEILNSVETTATVVFNLGEFLADYWFVPTNLSTLVAASRTLYASEAGRRGIGLTTDMEPSDKNHQELLTSRTHLQYAINNLLHNAVKYSFSGTGTARRNVRIIGRSRTDYYSLIFENYGIGITEQEIATKALFVSGYRGILTRREHRTGAGMGLAFVKRVIDNHGGKIIVTSRRVSDSDPEQSSPHLIRFEILLPYGRSQGRGEA